MKEEYFKFKSTEGFTDIDAKIWFEESVSPVGILQIAHGMNEYKERYDAFARFLAAKGFIVCAGDHLGHGNSILSRDKLGQMGSKNPCNVLIRDMNELRRIISGKYPDLPYFMMGHSMGSYLLRTYLSFYGEGLSGAVIMGTGHMPKLVARFGVGITHMLAVPAGWGYHSKLIPKLMYDKNYRRYDLTGKDCNNSWLTRDPEIVKAYSDDPKCSFQFALSGYRGLFQAVALSADNSRARSIPADLPMLVISGSEDPVGAMGESTKKAYEQLISTGHTHTSLKLYQDCRHELINELNRTEIYGYIYNWLSRIISK